MGGAGGNPEVVRMMREQQRAAERRQEARRLRHHERRKDGRRSPIAAEPIGARAACVGCDAELDLSQLFATGSGYRCDPCFAMWGAEDSSHTQLGEWRTQAALLVVPQLLGAVLLVRFPEIAMLLAIPGAVLAAATVDHAWRLGTTSPTWTRVVVGIPSVVLGLAWMATGMAMWVLVLR